MTDPIYVLLLSKDGSERTTCIHSPFSLDTMQRERGENSASTKCKDSAALSLISVNNAACNATGQSTSVYGIVINLNLEVLTIPTQ